MSDAGDTRTEEQNQRQPQQSPFSVTLAFEPRDGEEPLSIDDAAHVLYMRLGAGQFFRRETTGGEDFRAGLFMPYFLVSDRDRLDGDVVDQEKLDLARKLTRNLAELVPEASRTESVMQHVDVRSLLQELIPKRGQLGGMYIGDVYFTRDERAIAEGVLAEENARIEAVVMKVAGDMEMRGEFASPAERSAWVNAQLHGYQTDEGALGPSATLLDETPDANETALDAAARAEQQQGTSLWMQQKADAGLTNTTSFSFTSQADLQWMMQNDQINIAELRNEEATRMQAQAAGEMVPDALRVDTGGLLQGQGIRREDIGFGGNIGSTVSDSTNERVKLIDVINTPFYRDDAAVRSMQDKLIAGGYLDEDDVQFWGKGHDDATISAWRRLVRDSVNVGKSMKVVLEEAALAKAEEDEKASREFERDLVLSSTVGVQQMSDALGQSVIGRKLSAEDHARLVEFIHQLEREQHATLDPAGGQTAEEVDVEAEVSAWIEREHGTEAGAYDLLEQFQTFQQIARSTG